MQTGLINKASGYRSSKSAVAAGADKAARQPLARAALLPLLQRAEAAPHTLTPADAGRLQAVLGNTAVGALSAAITPGAGAKIQRVNINKVAKKKGSKKIKYHKKSSKYKKGYLITGRKRDIIARNLVPIFTKNKNKPSVIRIHNLVANQEKLFQQLQVAKLALPEKRGINQALDEIQAEIRSSIKEMTKDDPTFKELEAWHDQNQNDPLAMQLKSLMHNMFAEKPHSVPPNTDIANTYHTGHQNDPIPIIWYKPENAYSPITPISAKSGLPTLAFPGGGMINGLKFGLAPANRPINWTKANPIKKVSHESDRGNQKSYNTHLKNSGYRIGDDYNLDGDHVMDLGFNGQDELNNYWPLKSEVNRRAFHGYNESYVLNYYVIEHGQPVPKAKSIGGLLNRYFYVKGFMKSGKVPAESGKAKAGTDQA